jgi:Zn-dependent protease
MMGANVGFGLFNLIPWPPLDGWKMLGALLPNSVTDQMRTLELKMGIWSLVVLLLIMALGGKELLWMANGTMMNFMTGGQAPF